MAPLTLENAVLSSQKRSDEMTLGIVVQTRQCTWVSPLTYSSSIPLQKDVGEQTWLFVTLVLFAKIQAEF